MATNETLKQQVATQKQNEVAQGNKPKTIGEYIDQMAPAMAQALPQHMSIERMTRMATTVIRTTPQLKEADANDYSGGKAHGDEITNEFIVTVDGNEPENDKLIAFENVKVSTNSTVYRDSTIEEGIEIASKNRTILFDENQLTIEQDIEFLNDLTLDRAYLAMLPVLRTDQAGNLVTDTALVEGNNYDVSQSEFDIPELRDSENSEVTLAGEESGLSATVEVIDSSITPVELTISNNPAYNKIYFKNGGENVSVSSGQTWNQMTNYVLDYIN